MTRTESSLRNFTSALISRIVIIAVGFYCRGRFLSLLGSEYLGLGGLFGHLLSFLSLAEPGFTAAVIFAYYRPIAEGNHEKIKALNSFLNKMSLAAAVTVTVAGLSLLPQLEHFASLPPDIPSGEINSVYIISIAELASGFLYSSRRAFAYSDRRGYFSENIHTLFFCIMSFARLGMLYASGSYIAYTLTGYFFGLSEDILLHTLLGRRYPFLREEGKKLSHEETLGIFRRVCVLFFHRLSSIIVGSADNLSIIAFLGLEAGAMYSNYTMISGSLLSFVGIVTGSISSSLGNLDASSSGKRMENIFTRAFPAVLLAAFAASPLLYFAYPVIISAWLGEDFLLDKSCTLLFCINFFVSALRSIFLVFRDAMGLFSREAAKPFLEVAANLSVTLTLTRSLGIKGALLGQLAGGIVCLIYEPVVVFAEFRKRRRATGIKEQKERKSPTVRPRKAS